MAEHLGQYGSLSRGMVGDLAWFQQVNVHRGNVRGVFRTREKDISKRHLMLSPGMQGELSFGGSWFSPWSIEAASRFKHRPFRPKKDAVAQGDEGLISARDFPLSLDFCLANSHGRHFPSLARGRHHQREGPATARTLGWSHPV